MDPNACGMLPKPIGASCAENYVVRFKPRIFENSLQINNQNSSRIPPQTLYFITFIIHNLSNLFSSGIQFRMKTRLRLFEQSHPSGPLSLRLANILNILNLFHPRHVFLLGITQRHRLSNTSLTSSQSSTLPSNNMPW